MAERLGPNERRQISQLARALELQESFELHLLVGDTREVIEAALDEVLPGIERPWVEFLEGEAPKEFTSRWLQRLESALQGDGSMPVVLDAWSDDPAHVELWGWAFSRLNERRNGIMRALRRPLILLLSPEGERLLGRMAPDLWAIRGIGMRLHDRSPREEEVQLQPARRTVLELHDEVPRRGARRRALLIGSPFQLIGVMADVERMREQLTKRRFECTICMKPTRDAFLSALMTMHAETLPGDAVVIYYSGHGARCLEVDADGEPMGPAWSYFVMMDHDVERGFRGVAELELNRIVHAMARLTPNVTLILDCCFAGTMTRTTAELVKTLGLQSSKHEALSNVRHEHARQQQHESPEADLGLVRVSATSPDSSAFELDDPTGPGGYFTLELCAALDDALEFPVSWDTIIRRVRERIFERRGSTTQRPEIEGPRDRLPFSLTAIDAIRERSSLFYDGELPWIRAGSLHGLAVGDTVQITTDDVLESDLRARIVELSADTARLELPPAHPPPAAGSVAMLGPYLRASPVWVNPRVEVRQAIVEQVDHAPRLRLVDEIPEARFRISEREGGLLAEGEPWLHRRPRSPTEDGISALVQDLDDLARAQLLLEELDQHGSQLARIDWDARVFVTTPGQSEPSLFHPGEILRPNSRLYVELRHESRTHAALYINVLDHGVSGHLTLLNRSEPAGVRLAAPDRGSRARTVWVGRHPLGTMGTRIVWPVEVPKVRGLTEGLIVVASSRPLDLRNLLRLPTSGPTRSTVRREASPRPTTIGEAGRSPATSEARAIDKAKSPLRSVHPADLAVGPLRLEVRRFSFELAPE